MDTKQLSDKVNRLMENWICSNPAAGVAIAVTSGDQVVHTEGYGVMDVKTKKPVTKETLFHTASLSKTFVAMGVMILVEQGKLQLDHPVKHYIPTFSLSDQRDGRITVRHLLMHNSGMPDEADFQWERPETDDQAISRYVKSLTSKQLDRDPGTEFAYSNIGYEILGNVIEHVSGKPFETFMREEILEELGMSASDFLREKLSLNQVASPHILEMTTRYGAKSSSIFPYNRRHAPSSTLCTSASEISLYGMAVSQQIKVLKSQSYQEMFDPRLETGWGAAFAQMGLAWFSGTYNGTTIQWHSGLDTGFRSEMVIIPAQKISITILSNCDYVGLKVIWKTIIDSIQGGEVPVIKQSLARLLAKRLIEEGIEETENEFDLESVSNYLTMEEELNGCAYELFEGGKYQEALALLRMATRLYPTASNLYDSLGELTNEVGDRLNAVRYLEKAIALDPNNGEARANLEKVRG